MPNELFPGTRRTGDFFDNDPDTPTTRVTLERSDEGISIEVGWSTRESPYARWFVGKTGLELPPAQSAEPKDAPKRVLFHDSHGSVLLVGCYPRGFHANVWGPGTGRLWARAAIMGVEEIVAFDEPHGLQSEISGLREWLGISSWARTQDINLRESRVQVSIDSVENPTITVGTVHGLTLQFRPGRGIKIEQGEDRVVLNDLVRCTTESASAQQWDTHLQVHKGVRDLLVLSRWWEESCVPVRATRNDDPMRTLDGQTHGTQWREVVVPNDERKKPPRNYRPHLIAYSELGESGVASWLALRDEFARALDPVISSIDLPGATPFTRLAHTGPGIEALGYLLAVRDGMTEKKAGQQPLNERLDRILDDVGACLPFAGSTWADDTVRAYNGIKHANRAAPDIVDILNVWRQAVLVVRAWVALELGVDQTELTRRLAEDRQAIPYERRTP